MPYNTDLSNLENKVTELREELELMTTLHKLYILFDSMKSITASRITGRLKYLLSNAEYELEKYNRRRANDNRRVKY